MSAEGAFKNLKRLRLIRIVYINASILYSEAYQKKLWRASPRLQRAIRYLGARVARTGEFLTRDLKF